jgi:cytochrome P450
MHGRVSWVERRSSRRRPRQARRICLTQRRRIHPPAFTSRPACRACRWWETFPGCSRSAEDEETGKQKTDAQLRDEAVALFVAGYETTAAGMAWACHFLAQQPETARRLQAEVDGVLGSRQPGFADLQQLTYTRGVLQEALRMYPPSYWIPRTAAEDDELDGYRIPAGTQVAVLTYVLHHHPEIWESPQRFDPDRFTPERSAGRHKHAWIPFGAGQRQCIGKEFSLMEGQLILARVAQRFQPSAIPGREPQMQLSGSLHTRNGVWVRLTER